MAGAAVVQGARSNHPLAALRLVGFWKRHVQVTRTLGDVFVCRAVNWPFCVGERDRDGLRRPSDTSGIGVRGSKRSSISFRSNVDGVSSGQ